MPDMQAGRDAVRPGAAERRAERVAPDWRPLLRALPEALDAIAGEQGRDAVLHGLGRQLATQHPLTAQNTTDGLALEMNEVLGHFGWGRVRIAFSVAESCLYLTHEDLPRIGGRGDPPGTWLAAVFEGLYESWLAQQPGADATFTARRVPASEGGTVLIRYGKG